MKPRTFLQNTVAAPAYARLAAYAWNEKARGTSGLPTGRYTPGRIDNEFNLLLPGRREALKDSPRVVSFAGGKAPVKLGSEKKIMGWER